MIKVTISREAWNKALRAKPIGLAKQDTADLNEWCATHGVTWEIPNKKEIIAVCPDAQTAIIFKMTWL